MTDRTLCERSLSEVHSAHAEKGGTDDGQEHSGTAATGSAAM